MAERTQLRISDREEIAEDDPFAELTRIMGFDPRVSVKRPDAPSPNAGTADDFEIDLEKELMGEFGAAGEGDEPETAFVEDAAADEAAPADPHRMAEEDADPVARFDDDIAAAFDEDFEFEEIATVDDTGPAAEIEPAFEDQPASPAHVETAAFDLQSADGNEKDEDFADFEIVDFEPAQDAAPAVDVSAHDFEAEFDKAMADVDMDFDARPVEADEDTVALEDDGVSQPGDSEPVAHAVEPAVEPIAARNDSLEDELNALLNQMTARPLAETPYDEPVPETQASAVGQDWPASEQDAPVTAQDEPPQGEAVDYSALDDFDVDLVEDSPADPVGDDDSAQSMEIEFDHSAFDSALADEAEIENSEQVAAAHEEPVAEDPVDALKWLAAKPAADAFTSGHTWSRGTPYIQPAQPVAHAGATQAAASSVNPEPYEAPAAYDVAFNDPQPSEMETEAVAEAEVYESVEPVAAAPAVDEVPEIETVDIPERVVALADDLDIPEVPFENETPAKPVYDDLDAEFTTLLGNMNLSDPASAQSTAYGDGFYKDSPKREDAVAAVARPEAVQSAVAGGYAGAAYAAGLPGDDLRGSGSFGQDHGLDADDLAFDPDDFEEELALPDAAQAAAASQPRSRAMMIAALVGAVALIGGVGAFALSSGSGDGAGAPVLVKADDNPIKVKPENPGGTVIPNQDNKVYDMVAKGAKPIAPTQEKLVTDAEEPVDLAARARQEQPAEQAPSAVADDVAAAKPSGKSEDRITPAAVEPEASDQSDVALVTPRKVRTMVVKPDGSLVPREEPEAATAQVAATEPTDPAPQLVGNPSADQTGAVAPASGMQADQPAAANAPDAAAPRQAASTPAVAPVVPQRPAEQPVDIVGEVKPDKVAAVADTAGSAAASGAWSMQIASQPSVESAQSTYQDLARRYASVLEGHSVNIVKAEVAGKGTFYRVRVAANSRNEAISLCESYKAAGGNCFVSK
jgi:hypothetical protein